MLERIRLEFPTANLERLWNYFLLFEGEPEIDEKEYENIKIKVRYGYKIQFDIYSYINNKIKYKSNGSGLIAYFGGYPYLQMDLYTEIEARCQTIKKFLLKHTEQTETRNILAEHIEKK